MWMTVGTVVFLLIGGVITVFIVAQEFDPEYEAPPANNRAMADAGSLEECPMLASKVGGEVEVRRLPGRNEMVVGAIPDGTLLEVVSVRVDFVEISGPVEGFVDRRETRQRCGP